MKPLFKWTGGKTKMRDKYGRDFWPQKPFTRFIDTFYGGGSVSHWVLNNFPETEFVINDQNSELIQMYRVIRDNPSEFLEVLLKLERDYLAIPGDTVEEVYKNRHIYYTGIKMTYINDFQTLGTVAESAHLYFLMKTSFNGWWKVYNYSNGRYATPPGTLDQKTNFIDVDLIQEHHRFFKERCTILNGDFEVVRPYITSDSYVYFDPPYRDSSTEYTEQGFTDVDQIRLCELFRYADSVGASVSESNKEIGDGFFEKHLDTFEILLYDVKYTAGRGTTLNNVKENFIRNFQPMNHEPNELFTQPFFTYE